MHLTQPLISVAICTYNRVDRLVLALEALTLQSLSCESFEVLVVDNRSTDTTKEACINYQTKLPNLRYIYESVQGLSKARNTALQQAQGEYIAYLDDDAIPAPGWIESILTTFQTVQPQPVCVGGPIYPLWEIPKPDWLHPYLENLYTVMNCGDEPQWFRPQRFPYGANIAYKRAVLEKVGGFNEDLGRRGNLLLSNEERLLNLLLEKQGGQFYYQPQAPVQHWVPKERIQPAWLVSRSYWQGRSEAIADQIFGKSIVQQRCQSLLGILNPKRVLAQLLPNANIRVRTRVWMAWQWGYFEQVWLHSLPR